MNCPNCGTLNKDFYQFCLKCGQPLAGGAQFESQLSSQSSSSDIAPTPFHPASQSDSSILQTSSPRNLTQLDSKDLAHSSSRPLAVRQPETSYGGSGTGLLNIWGPFAGYGARRRHIGWLMDGQGHKACDLQTSVGASFSKRAIPKTRVFKRTLSGRGLGVERRPYFILQRGLVSMGLYIAAFGNDLFISLVSYIKPPISTFRVLVALVMLAFQAFMMYLYPITMNAALDDVVSGTSLFSGIPDLSGLLTLACLVGPLGLVNTIGLVLLLLFSAYKWLTEKDFWAALRVPPNEFNEDDLMGLEKAVEQTVRLGLDDIQLSFEEFTRVDMTEKVWRI